MPASPKDILDWNIATKNYRDCLDIATIYCFWSKFVDDLDSYQTLVLIRSLMGDDIITIDPDELWKPVLVDPLTIGYRCIGVESYFVNRINPEKLDDVIESSKTNSCFAEPNELKWCSVPNYRHTISQISGHTHCLKFDRFPTLSS